MIWLLACASSGDSGAADDSAARQRRVDTHAHFASGDVSAAAEALDLGAQGWDAALFMPTPQVPDQDHTTTAQQLHAAGVERVVAGGGTLNVQIQAAVAGAPIDEGEFAATAESLLNQGALGFGELAAEHVVIGGTEPYVSAPPDHPLFLRLAEVAASRGVPIDLHMEAVTADRDTPDWLRENSANPETLSENVSGLEALLEHAEADIVWAHGGWDPLGERTPELTEQLLSRHDNLYISLKATGEGTLSTLVVDGALDPDWLGVIERYPERFLLGSDHFHLAPGQSRSLPQGGAYTADLVELLPPDLRGAVAWDNAARLYGL